MKDVSTTNNKSAGHRKLRVPVEVSVLDVLVRVKLPDVEVTVLVVTVVPLIVDKLSIVRDEAV